ncbi:MAG: hypothetical protein AB8B96_16235 [Lysobacterales bacterium]
MTYTWLLVFHIAVLGYWLGAEFVINSTYRYVCLGRHMPMAERMRLMDHVMQVDQHVRYALILQAGLGTGLAAIRGDIPGGNATLMAAGAVTALWLIFVEIVHRRRASALGKGLATLDRWMRYILVISLTAVALGLLFDAWPMGQWLRWKLGLFAGVIACGLGIRLVLIRQFAVWSVMQQGQNTDENNQHIHRTYRQATSVLLLLWAFIIGIVVLSVMKPGV